MADTTYLPMLGVFLFLSEALGTIAQHGFDACIGGARRDEEKARARAKERIISFRDAGGGW